MSKLFLNERFIIHFSMFMMGGCGLAYEYTLSKVSSDLLGNSARQWAIIIGVMMFFMGIGSDLQKFIKDRNLFDRFVLFEILLGLTGGLGPIIILYSYSTIRSHFILVQYFFISIVGLIIGLEVPLLTRINASYSKELKYNLGGILKMDYIGALCGAMFWVFVLTPFFTIVETAFVLGIINLITGVLALLFFRKYIVKIQRLLVLATFSVFILMIGFVYAKEWTSFAEQYLFRDRIVFSKTTEFQHIVLTESAAGDLSCFINGHLQFNSADEFIYHENLVHPAMEIAARKKKILVLGGGDGLAVREILKYPEVNEIILVDIDPEMTKLARENFHLLQVNDNSLTNAKVNVLKNNELRSLGEEDLYVMNQKAGPKPSPTKVASVKIINLDAAKFVEQIRGFFDIIFIDFPDPNSLELAKLYSIEFYQNIKKKLTADGLFVQQSTSPYHAREAFLCIGRTMNKGGLVVVPFHDNVPSFGEWGWWIGGKEERYNENTIRERLTAIESLNGITQYLTPELIRASLVFGKDQLHTNQSDITSITNSKVFEYYLQGWKMGN